MTPRPDGSVIVEDLESTNGTFVNRNELHGPGQLEPGDELLVGVTVMDQVLFASDPGEITGIHAPPARLVLDSNTNPTAQDGQVRERLPDDFVSASVTGNARALGPNWQSVAISCGVKRPS